MGAGRPTATAPQTGAAARHCSKCRQCYDDSRVDEAEHRLRCGVRTTPNSTITVIDHLEHVLAHQKRFKIRCIVSPIRALKI